MGRVYYVAANGDDANPGTQVRPWHTLQHAADVLQPGETVQVRAGTYNEAVTLTYSGEPNQPITFMAYPGESVILDGDNQTLYAAFQTTFSEPDPYISDIILSGFTIQNYAQYGLVMWSINDRFTITDLVIHDNGSEGIRFSNSDGSRVERIVLTHNEGGFDCTPILPGAESDPGCTNLYVSDVQAIDNGTIGDTGNDQFAIERGVNNTITHSLATGGVGDGFDIKSDNSTLTYVIAHDTRNNIKMWGKNSLLFNALAYDAKADANLVLVAGGSYTVVNVTIANMIGTAYLVVAGDTGSTPITIRNSIFYNDNPAMEGTLLYFGPDVKDPIIENNLFFNPYRIDSVICADFAPFNGQCWSDADLSTFGAHNAYADPRFVKASVKDFHLSANSPALNAGVSTPPVPSDDLDGNPRDPAPDLGAYETTRSYGVDVAIILDYGVIPYEQIIDTSEAIFLGQVLAVSGTSWNQDSSKYWEGGLPVHTIDVQVLQPIVDTLELPEQVTITQVGYSPLEGRGVYSVAVGQRAVFFVVQTHIAWRDRLVPVLRLTGDPADSVIIVGDERYAAQPTDAAARLNEIVQDIAERREVLPQPDPVKPAAPAG